MPDERKKTKKTIETVASAVSPFHISVDRAAGGFSVSVCDVVSITEFLDEYVLLELSFAQLKINGAGLDLRVYEQSRVDIIGKISNLEFSYDKT